MKTFTILFFSLFFLSNISAQQEWAPIGAKWYYHQTFFWSPNTGVNIFESVGDTIIDNQSCRVISISTQNCTGVGLEIYMYADSNQVFYRLPSYDSFSLFYDFNAEPGDFWDVQNYMYPDLGAQDSTYRVTVNEVDTININNQPLKRMFVEIAFDSDFAFETVADTLIEKLGSTTKMFPFEVPICDAQYDRRLRCYEDTDLGLVSLTNVDCEFTPINNVALPKTKIYPSHFSDFLMVETEEEVQTRLVTATGQILLEKKLDRGENRLSTHHLQKGVYFIQLFDNNKHLINVKKLIKIE